MKVASKILLGLVAIFAVTVLTVARAEDKEEKKAEAAKAVTLKGTICCSKCELAETKACGTTIKVKKDGKDMTYYFIDAGRKEKYHGKICTAPKEGSVTGVVSKKGEKNYIKPSKDGVKFD